MVPGALSHVQQTCSGAGTCAHLVLRRHGNAQQSHHLLSTGPHEPALVSVRVQATASNAHLDTLRTQELEALLAVNAALKLKLAEAIESATVQDAVFAGALECVRVAKEEAAELQTVLAWTKCKSAEEVRPPAWRGQTAGCAC